MYESIRKKSFFAVVFFFLFPISGSGSLNEVERKLSCSVKLDKWDSAIYAAKTFYDPV